uniref:Uncharacterized protein n=1 Tax=Onchocerca volvulus TaxID=6282 RepID=A0A8R1XS48_ONCVO
MFVSRVIRIRDFLVERKGLKEKQKGISFFLRKVCLKCPETNGDSETMLFSINRYSCRKQH